jgi:hypothetical protein
MLASFALHWQQRRKGAAMKNTNTQTLTRRLAHCIDVAIDVREARVLDEPQLDPLIAWHNLAKPARERQKECGRKVVHREVTL